MYVASWCSACYVLFCMFVFVRAICNGALKLDMSILFSSLRFVLYMYTCISK